MKVSSSKAGISSDSEIIQKIVGGEPALYEVLIRRYNALLYKIARSYGFNHQDAEDLMQEAYLTAYLQLATLHQPAAFKGWLAKILIRKCLYKLSYGYFKNEQPGDGLLNEKTGPMFCASHTGNTEHTVINRELSNVLEKALQGVPLTYRTIFVLREIEGFTVAETAEILNLSAINVKVRLNRAKALLQKQLEQFYAATDIYEFNRSYCDAIVKKVFEKIAAGNDLNS